MVEGSFNGQNAGDETRRYGDYYYDTAGEALEAGDLVAVTSSGVVKANAADGHSAIFGVAYIDAESGEQATVKTNGGVIAKSDGSRSIGEVVAIPDTNADGTAGVASGAGGSDFIVVATGTDADGNDVVELSK